MKKAAANDDKNFPHGTRKAVDSILVTVYNFIAKQNIAVKWLNRRRRVTFCKAFAILSPKLKARNGRRKIIRGRNGGNILDRKLYLLIEEADAEFDESIAYSDAIVALSGNPAASSVLANEMRQAAVDSELKWKAIEQTPEFRAAYSDRDEARADFLKAVFANEQRRR